MWAGGAWGRELPGNSNPTVAIVQYRENVHVEGGCFGVSLYCWFPFFAQSAVDERPVSGRLSSITITPEQFGILRDQYMEN